MSFINPLINSVSTRVMQKRMHQIELFVKYPHQVQEEWFHKLLYSGSNTEWGRRYEYSSIRKVEEYKNRVPVQDYESLKEYIFRTREGEQNILWPTDIKWFAKSSGTTSDKSKFIPVTRESLEECHFKGGKDMLSIYCHNNPDTQLFSGKGLMIGGSRKIDPINEDSYSGDLSAILINELPLWTQLFRTPDSSIALMDEWEAKIQRIAETTMSENVTNIMGVPSWTLVLIKYMLEKTGKKSLLEIWPNLELFMHGGVSFAPYREQFKKLIPSSKMHYLETYNASEGFFGIQDQNNENALLLMLDYGIFYEFVPMGELDKKFPKTLTLAEVETETDYALLISTNGGLWRYMTGDTIQFTTLKPYRIKVSGRTQSFINAFGEELMVHNADIAIEEASKQNEALVKDYTAAPVFISDSDSGAHEWCIEFEKEPKSIDQFMKVLDETLKKVNSDYEAKRHKNMALRFPIIHLMPKGTFYNWLKLKGKLGGQNKVPRLSNNRKIIEEILQLHYV
jgi:hypothetical protein